MLRTYPKTLSYDIHVPGDTAPIDMSCPGGRREQPSQKRPTNKYLTLHKYASSRDQELLYEDKPYP